MAIYSLHTEPASRSSGKNAIAMAAYRSGGRLIDERTGEIKDYSRKQGIIETALIYPQAVNFDRQTLWNMAERAEKRKDSRIAREIRIALPHELDQNERSKLVKYFAQAIVDRYQIAVDLSIHQPDRKGDNRNFHAHLLLTTRQITTEGLSDKSDLEKNDKALKKSGKLNGKEQIIEIREQWENLCNIALERKGREERISAKSYKERNIDLIPTIHLGPSVTAMERKGIETEKGNYNREVKSRNRRRILLFERDRLQKEIDLLTNHITELKNELNKEIEVELHQELSPQPAPKNIDQELYKDQKQPIENPQNETKTIDQILTESQQKITDNEQAQELKDLSVTDLLNRQIKEEKLAKKAGIDRNLSVSELLEQSQINNNRELKRNNDGLER